MAISRDLTHRYQKYCKYATENAMHSLCITSWHLRSTLTMERQRNLVAATAAFLPVPGKQKVRLLDLMDCIETRRKITCVEICQDRAILKISTCLSLILEHFHKLWRNVKKTLAPISFLPCSSRVMDFPLWKGLQGKYNLYHRWKLATCIDIILPSV